MVKKKSELSHYPWFFLSKLVFRTIYGIVFAILFVGLGKKYLKIDILGKIYGFVFGGETNFNQYFLGANGKDKSTLLNYSVYFLAAIIILNIISLLLNSYLGKKDKYIENNNFYLHNKGVFTFNSLKHVACTFLLIFSFVSPFTVILALLFITFNTWDLFPHPKGLKNPQTERFFSGKNQYIRKMLFYSAIVVLVIPLVIGRLRSFYKNASSNAPTGLARSFNDVLSTSPTLKKIVEMLTGDDFSLDLLYGFILFGFVIKDLINSRGKEFQEFWTKVNGVEKQVKDFKHYYFYQESGAIANNALVNLGDYSYLENSPKLLNKSYSEGDLDTNNFAKENQKIVKYIKFCESKIKEPSKRSFLNYCLFNEFNSGEDCLRTKKLIKAVGK